MIAVVAATDAHAPCPVGQVTFLSEAVVAADVVRLGDVADLSPLPSSLRDLAGTLPVARLIGDEQVLSSRRLSERARASVPALTAWLSSCGDDEVHVRSRHRRHEGEVIVLPTTAGEEGVRSGQALTLRVVIGSVVVEREVEALQAGRPGRPIFVRTSDDAVLRARVGG